MFNKNSNLKVEREPLNRLVKKWVTALTLSLVILFQGCDEGFVETAFVTEWETTLVDKSITIPINSSYSSDYNYTVDWGDGTTSTETAEATHTYSTPGIHTVKITGDFPAIYFNNTGDGDKIKKITNWGIIKWKSFLYAFVGCSNLELTATDSPDLSGVTSLQGMFHSATSFNTDINHWDVSSIANMYGMFSSAINFNQPLDKWDTSSVTNMNNMFENASSFSNQDLSGWDVGNVGFNYDEFDLNWGEGNTLPIWQ